MTPKLRHNIAVKQARTAVIAAVCIGLLFSFAQLAYDIFQEREDTHAAVAHIMGSLKEPAAEAAYSLSPELATKVLNGVFQNPQVKEGYLYAMFGTGETELLASHVRKTGPTHLQWLARLITEEDKIYTLELDVSTQDKPTGLLQLKIDGGVLAQAFLDRAVVIFSAGLLRNVALTFVLVIVFYETLTKPIVKISQQISELDADHPEQTLMTIPPAHQHDEFGALIKEINTSRQAVGSAFEKLRIAEAEKDQSMQMFHALAKATSDIFWKTNQDFDLEIISEDKSSRELDEVLKLTGSSLKKIVEANHINNDTINLSDYWSYPRDFRNVQLKFNVDETPLVLSFYGSASFDQEGHFIGYLGTATDITEALQQSWKIEETQEQLRQAQKMEAVGQLTGGIAHDFNNLLAVIIGNLELLEEKTLGNQELAKLLHSAIRSSEKGAKLTQQLLAFSRKQSLQPQFVDLNNVIENVLQMLNRTLGGAVSIKTDLGKDLMDCFVDPAQFENVLLNLSLNARDAMPEGGTLTFRTEAFQLGDVTQTSSGVLQPGPFVKVTVSDTGTGMSESEIEKSLEPFYTTKEVGKGSGMGLPMVYGFIAQSVGHIVLESTVELGTDITLFLPCREPDPDIIENQSTPKVAFHH